MHMNPFWCIKDQRIRTLDCTIRDGGLVNDHRFTLDFVRALYRANIEAGVDYMEIGYKNSDRIFSRDENGPWKFCDEKDIRAVVEDSPSTKMKLSCMIDAAKSDWKTAVAPCAESPLDMIRVAFYEYQLDEAVAMIEDAKEKGYEVSANLMAVTVVPERRLDEVLERVCNTRTNAVVIVDSFGSLTPIQTEYLTKKYLSYAEPLGIEVGMHAHNNLQLAFANTFLSAQYGATRLDCSLGGLGRGAGNCPSEYLLSVLNPGAYKLRPLYQCLQDEVVPLRQIIDWGTYNEYAITAQFNVHPRSAIAHRKSPETRDKYAVLYDKLTEEMRNQETP